MGVEATLRRARETIFWPAINTEMKDLLDKCKTCQSYKPAPQKESFQQHYRPMESWSKVSIDLFQFEERNYVVVVDYMTNFWEIDCLGHNPTARHII